MSEVIEKLGLSALFGDHANKAEKEKETLDKEFRHVPTSKLSVSNFQPRTEFDATSLKELSDSIAKSGIIQPIVVRHKFAGEYEIIAGERRWRAAKLLNLDTVPVIIKRLADKEVFELAIIENVQRKDLNPLEEAYAYRRLLGEFGYTQDDLARTVGKSRSHIANLLRLLSLPEKVKTLLTEGKLTMSHARTLLNAPDPQALAMRIIEEGLSVRQVEEIAAGKEITFGQKDALQEEDGKPSANTNTKSKHKNADIVALEEILNRSLGSPVDIKSTGKKGEIRIKYTTLEELDNLLRKLGAAA